MMEHKQDVNFIYGYKDWQIKGATVEGPYPARDDSLELSSFLYDPYSAAQLPGESVSLPCVSLSTTRIAKTIDIHRASRSHHSIHEFILFIKPCLCLLKCIYSGLDFLH